MVKQRKAFYIPEDILLQLDEIYLNRYATTKDSFSDLIVEAIKLLVEKESNKNLHV